MAENGKAGVGAFVLSIVAAVLTAGSAPWWWPRIHHEPTPTPTVPVEASLNATLPTVEAPKQADALPRRPEPAVMGPFLYQAELSAADHCNSKGERHRVASFVVQQDRANFYKDHRDPGDDASPEFAAFEARVALAKSVSIGSADAKKILTTTPTIGVSRTESGYRATVIRDGAPFNSCD